MLGQVIPYIFIFLSIYLSIVNIHHTEVHDFINIMKTTFDLNFDLN